MSGERKHRSLKDILRKANGPGLLNPQLSPTDTLSISSHRFFLRKRNSKTSVTSSSASSVSSAHETALSMVPSESTKSVDSVASLAGHHDDKKCRHRKKEKKEKRRGLLGNGSHHLLKRFFKILNPADHGSGEAHDKPPPTLPLSATSDLARKYDLGRLIGQGASGLVNLVADKNDATKIYAVKKFRTKLKGESEHDYKTKVKNEFLIGDYLTHQNLIHTMELIQDQARGEFFIIMEYCPFDFFNLVMSGLMTKEEIYCYTKQIINGVYHLHKAGVAHRDLKLDNCVVDTNGVLKLIDFGSAFQFKKQIDPSKPAPTGPLIDEKHRFVPAKGIVGSDPYLSPEVFEGTQAGGYDARLADVWSIAIIFCCMLLKRFPWKVPRNADPSFRAFAGLNNQDEPVSDSEKVAPVSNGTNSKEEIPKYGPERLLRLLPRRSRTLVKGMLEIDVSKRYFMEDVVADPFYQSIEVCHYAEEDEQIIATQEESPSQVDTEQQDVEVQEQVLPESSTPSEILTEDTAIENVPTAEDATQLAELPIENFDEDDSSAATAASNQVAPTEAVEIKAEVFVKSQNHTHHLVTEKDLERMNAEREKARKSKDHETS